MWRHLIAYKFNYRRTLDHFRPYQLLTITRTKTRLKLYFYCNLHLLSLFLLIHSLLGFIEVGVHMNFSEGHLRMWDVTFILKYDLRIKPFAVRKVAEESMPFGIMTHWQLIELLSKNSFSPVTCACFSILSSFLGKCYHKWWTYIWLEKRKHGSEKYPCKIYATFSYILQQKLWPLYLTNKEA